MTSILCQWKPPFNATNSNAITSKPKDVFSTFFCISGIYIKFEILKKKDEPRKLPVSEIIACKIQGYLNAQKPRLRTLMDS